MYGCSTIPSSLGSCLGLYPEGSWLSPTSTTLCCQELLSVVGLPELLPTKAAFHWLDLVQVSCVQSQALWVHVYNSPVMPSRSFHCRHSWPLSTPCLKWSPSLVEIERDIDLPFRDKPDTVFYCLHTDWLSVPFILPLSPVNGNCRHLTEFHALSKAHKCLF